MLKDFTKFLFGVCLFDAFVLVNALKCFEHACNGTNCLSTEVVNNPLLIKKCDRVIYKGCYTPCPAPTGVGGIAYFITAHEQTQTEPATYPCLVCWTVTTKFSEFSMTTAGCVDKQFICTEGTCSGAFVTTEVTCCNTDLCNDGIVYSHSDNTRTGASFLICLLMNILCLRK